eukprot:944645_1
MSKTKSESLKQLTRELLSCIGLSKSVSFTDLSTRIQRATLSESVSKVQFLKAREKLISEAKKHRKAQTVTRYLDRLAKSSANSDKFVVAFATELFTGRRSRSRDPRPASRDPRQASRDTSRPASRDPKRKQSRDPKSATRNPKSFTRNPKPASRNPKSASDLLKATDKLLAEVGQPGRSKGEARRRPRAPSSTRSSLSPPSKRTRSQKMSRKYVSRTSDLDIMQSTRQVQQRRKSTSAFMSSLNRKSDVRVPTSEYNVPMEVDSIGSKTVSVTSSKTAIESSPSRVSPPKSRLGTLQGFVSPNRAQPNIRVSPTKNRLSSLQNPTQSGVRVSPPRSRLSSVLGQGASNRTQVDIGLTKSNQLDVKSSKKSLISSKIACYNKSIQKTSVNSSKTVSESSLSSKTALDGLRSNFRNNNFGARAIGSNVTGPNMTGSNMTGSSKTVPRATGSNMTGPSVNGSNKTVSRVTGSNVTGSILTGSNVTGSKKIVSNVTGSNVNGSDKTGFGSTNGILARNSMNIENVSRFSNVERSSDISSRRSVDSSKNVYMSPKSLRELNEVKSKPVMQFKPKPKVLFQPYHQVMTIRDGDMISLRSQVASYASLEGAADSDLLCHGTTPFMFCLNTRVADVGRKELCYGDAIILSTEPEESENKRVMSLNWKKTVHATPEASEAVKWVVLSPDGDKKSGQPVQVTEPVLLRSVDGFLSVRRDGKAHVQVQSSEGALWQISKGALPYMPNWTSKRSRLFTEIIHGHTQPSERAEKLSAVPRAHRYKLVVQDLLFALMGIGGNFIRIKEGTVPEFYVDSLAELDEATSHIVGQVLPLCDAFARLDRFCSTHSLPQYGLVSQALCAALKGIKKEYLILIAQLEHQSRISDLTLQKLWFYVQSPMASMRRISTLCAQIDSADPRQSGRDTIISLGGRDTMSLGGRDSTRSGISTSSVDSSSVAPTGSVVTGGALLNLLDNQLAKEGDSNMRTLLTQLLSSASAPYFRILSQWIFRGVVRDPFGEFQIEEARMDKNKVHTDVNDQYWVQRYRVRRHMLPRFLARLSARILTTGKYLNVIRESGREVNFPGDQKLEYTTSFREYSTKIEEAYSFATQKLLNLLLGEEKLMDRLRSLKRYFMFEHGDFIVHFMDLALDELGAPVKNIRAANRLESLLDLALRSSSAAQDPYSEDLSCQLSNVSLLQQLNAIHEAKSSSRRHGTMKRPVLDSSLTGIDAICFEYKVRWPLSLVISRKALTKYQFVFRHLFSLKHVERQLCSAWIHHQTTKELDIGSAMSPSHCLRQRMLHFVQNLLFYLLVEAIEPSWHRFATNMRSATTVDEVIQFHDEFLGTCVRECLLTEQELLKTLSKILATCLHFASYTGRVATEWRASMVSQAGADNFGKKKKQKDLVEQRRMTIKIQSEQVRAIANDRAHLAGLQRLQSEFDTQLATFLTALRERSVTGDHLVQLCTRLDYNGFYEKHIR